MLVSLTARSVARGVGRTARSSFAPVGVGILNNRHSKHLESRTIFTEAIQSGLITIHESTGMPWWLTFASSTMLVRVGLFPLVRVQMNEGRKLSKAMPELNFLKQLATERLKSIPTGQSAKQWSDEVLNTFGIFRKGVRASLSLHEVSMIKFLGAPLTNMASFITFVWSIREMLQGNVCPDVGLDMGGMLWFEDLTEEDIEHVLPLVAGLTSYSAIEYSFNRPGAVDKGSLGFKIKDWIQTMSLCMVPVFLQLPAGCFCYWIPSSIVGMAQTYAGRNEAFVRLLKLPPVPQARPQAVKRGRMSKSGKPQNQNQNQ